MAAHDWGGDVIVCRCEHLTWGEVRAVVQDGYPTSPRQVKEMTRWGMGICQGRMCRPLMAALAMDKEEGLSARPPFRPLNLGDLGQLEEDADE